MTRDKREIGEKVPGETGAIRLPFLVAKKIFESTGDNYFRTITEIIVRELDLGLDHSVVAELVEGKKVKTLSFYADDHFADNAEYDLEGIPCQFVPDMKACFYPSGVRKVFPRALLLDEMQAESFIGLPLLSSGGSSLGFIAGSGRAPLQESSKEEITALLQVLAAGAVSRLEQRRREDAARTSEADYRAIFDSANDGIFIHDIETGDVVGLNRKASEIYGYSLEEFRHFIDESLFTGVPGYTAQDAMKRIQSAARGLPQVFEWLSKRKDGRLFWVEVNLKRAVIGGQTRLLAIVRDITERKQSEEALELIQFSVDHAAVSAFLIDRNARLLYVNEEACRTLGYSRQELLRMTVGDLDPDSVPQWEDHWKQLKRDRRVHYERVHRRKDGTFVTVDVSGNYVSFGGREYNWAFAVDIDQRKKAEQRLQESEERFRQLAENTDQVFWFATMDPERVIYVSPAYERIWGHRAEELYADPRLWLEPVHPGDRSRVEAAFVDWINLKSPRYDIEYRIVRADGAVRWIRDRGTLIRDDRGKVACLSGIADEITDRKKAEQEISRTMALLEEAQHIAGIGNWEWDPRTGRLTGSDEVYRILDLRHDQIKGTYEAFLKMLHPDDRPTIEKRIAAAFRDRKQTSQHEYRIIRHDGRTRILSLRSRFEYDPAGLPVAVRGTVQDVTEARRNEKSIKLTQFAVDHASVSAFINASDGRILYANREACRTTGYSRQELLSLTIPGLDPNFQQWKWSDHWEELKKERFLHFESVHRRKDGTLFPVEISVNYLAFGDREYMVGFALDITDRKKAEHLLQESEERFRGLAENTDQVFWFITPQERVLYVSPAFESIWGRGADELYRDPGLWMDLVHPEDRVSVETAFSAWTSGKAEKFDVEYRIMRPDGGIRWIRDRGTMIRDAHGRVIRLSGIADDITDRKSIEQEVEKTRALLEEAQHIAGIGNWEWDLRANKIVWSDEVYRIFGMRRGKFKETFEAFMELVHPEDRTRIEKNVAEAAAGRKEQAFNEYRIVRPDGKMRILYTRSLFLYDRSGRLTGIRGTAQDVTEARRAEEMLQLMKFSVDHAAVAAHLLDKDGRFLYVNDQMCRSLGYSRDELLKKSIADIDPDFPFSLWGDKWIELKQRGSLQLETRHRRKDGSIYPVEITANYLEFAGAEYNWAFAIDLSERKSAENSIRHSYKLTETILNSINDPISLIDVRDFTIVRVNTAFLEKYRYSDQSDVTGKHCYEITHHRPDVCSAPDDICPLIETVKTREHFAAEHVHYDSRGEKIYVEVATSPVKDEAGNVVQVVHVQRDITERKRAEEALRESEERFRAFFESAGVGAAQLDPITGRFLRVNDRFCLITGYSREEILSRTFKDLTHPDDREADSKFFARVVAGEVDEYDAEKRYIHKDGHTIWVHISSVIIRNKEGKPVRTAGIIQDITERKRMEEEIRHLAHHDALTGLPNRRMFNEIIALELAQAQRNKKKSAILFLDLDRFKEINDTLGHEAGDSLLKQVASRIRTVLRKSDTISRIGGDEFNIILTDIARSEDVSDIVRKLINAFKGPFLISGHELRVTASIGISIYPDDSDEIDALLRYSDMAMYHAKESGRNTFRFYNPSINIRTIERIRLENMLLRSLELGELVIYYQPLIDIATRKIVCAEALIRWRHPQKQLLLPKDFLPAAEDTGFIAAIDEFVLASVCRQMRTWQDAGLPRLCVTVNLSPRQFQSADLKDKIGSILKRTGVPADCLDIEISESMAMSNVERSAGRMRELTEMGIHMSIDDFGTGYSSLNYLKRLPIERLKIDRSFIQDIAGNRDDRAIVTAVTLMAHTMNMKVVAEGVETEGQLDLLRELNCDEAQGFLFSKPLSSGEFARQLVQTK